MIRQCSNRVLLACVAFIIFAGLVGCHVPPAPKKMPEVVRTDTNPKFGKAREDLVDIVVLAARPPEGDPRADGPHLRRFRRKVYEGLVNKGYSPLKLNFVDQAFTDEPITVRADPDQSITKFGEDAIMVLSLNEWDRRFVRQENGIMISATLSLIKSKPKEKLWMHEIRHRLYKIPLNADERHLTIDEVVVDLVVKDLLAKLPSRA